MFLGGFVQHVPRIVGEIPSIDEATLDHQRLLERCYYWSLLQNVFLFVSQPNLLTFSFSFSRIEALHFIVSFVKEKILSVVYVCAF